MPSISKKLTIAILLSCASYIPYPTLAEEPEHTPHLWEVKTKDAAGNERPFLIFDVHDSSVSYSYRDFLPHEKEALQNSLQYISDLVGFPQEENIPHVKLELKPEAVTNAQASSDTFIQPDTYPTIGNTKLAECIQSTKKVTDLSDDTVARIIIYKSTENSPWDMGKFPLLPNGGTQPNYSSVVAHEIFHALGLFAPQTTEGSRTFLGTPISMTDKSGVTKTSIAFNSYEIGLRDIFGRIAYYGKDENDQPVYFDAHPETIYTYQGLLGSRQIKTISDATYQQLLKDPEQIDKDAFYLLTVDGGASFTGNHVKEVLTLNGQEALIAWPDQGGNTPIQGGLPINGFDSIYPDLSHIELQNSLLSHQDYRNWSTFMEAELAVLQDMGFTIDRSQYFGKSIYNSGTIDDENHISYFTYENQTDFRSQKNHAIGLHLYGYYLDVVQKGTISADGDSSMGIRVDGVGNHLTIDNHVRANGSDSSALAVTYGKNHEITLQKEANLVAMGEGGVAARFDFGSNVLGDTKNYRGSYFVVKYDDQAKEWFADTLASTEDIDGALVRRFDVQGLLAGKEEAIYISPNAYVQNINFMEGTTLYGNILSEWNPKQIKYQNEDVEEEDILRPLIPDEDPYEGRTILTFGTEATKNGQSSFHLDDQKEMTYTPDTHFSLTYEGNITGPESLEVKALGGTLTYNGKADVYSFAIGKDGTIKGTGNYTVKQNFTNDGTFALSQQLQSTNIEGNYIQGDTGHLIVGFNGKRQSDTLKVTGTATIDGTLTLSPTPDYYKGNMSFTTDDVLSADSGVTGQFNTVTLPETPVSSTLDFSITSSGDNYTISASRAFNAYSRLATDSLTRDIATAFDKKASYVQGNAQDLVAAIDFAGSAADVNTALGKLNPSLYGIEGQSQLQSQALLDNLSPLGHFSSSHASEDWTASENQVDSHNSHAIAMPFSSYTNQHKGGQGYKAHQTGFLGAVEHTRSNGLTLGWHGAVSHQSISDTSGSVKGNAFYMGAQANYAPDDWNGWSLFGSARLGVEQMKSRRHVTINSFTGNSHADWTGFSSDFRLGGALTKETPSIQYGPFASIAYRFAHRPSITEEGDAWATHLDSTTYDSLSTQLGYQFSTRPKNLSSFEVTTWQLHSSLSWNHELLSNNGHTGYSFRDLPGITISDPTADYGRDSLSLSAGLTLRTPKSWDVTFQVGSDMYRKGGSSTYGKVNVEWRF